MEALPLDPMDLFESPKTSGKSGGVWLLLIALGGLLLFLWWHWHYKREANERSYVPRFNDKYTLKTREG